MIFYKSVITPIISTFLLQ